MSIFKRIFCRHEYEFVRNIYGDEINHVGGKRSWWRCVKCGKWKVDEHLQKVEVVSEYIDNGMMCSNDTCEHDVNSVQINLSEIEPSTELKREDRVSVDHDGNVTAYLFQDTREQLEANMGDAVAILLMAARGGFEGSTGNVMKNAKVLLNMSKEKAPDSEVFQVLADIVERKRADLTAERDKWKAKRDIREVLAENAKFWEDKRNQWKAELETYWRDVDLSERTGCEQDTREKLEADAISYVVDNVTTYEETRLRLVDKIKTWLDRQAAITKRECSPEAINNMLNTIDELEEKVDELTAERYKMKKRLEHQVTYIAGVEDNLCRYELQLVRNEKDFDKLTAERDRLQTAVDALKHDREEVCNLTAIDDRLTAVQARETAMNSDDKWIQNCADEVVRNILYVIWQESRKGLFNYQVDFKPQPFEVREAALMELSELGYNYKQQHWWNKDKYIISW